MNNSKFRGEKIRRQAEHNINFSNNIKRDKADIERDYYWREVEKARGRKFYFEEANSTRFSVKDIYNGSYVRCVCDA